jgi:UDP-3-O-[3-hydroxymyristoyl] glucosamine N-acyltransferase
MSVPLGDPRFFDKAGPFALDALVAIAPGEILRGEILNGIALTGVAPLQTATAQDVSVLHNPRYTDALEQTRAGLIIVPANHAKLVPLTSAGLVVKDAHAAWAKIATLFHPPKVAIPGIHPSAVIDPAAQVDPTVEIGPNAVIAARAEIGAHCRIGACATIAEGVILGPHCRIGANASVSHAILGARVYIYPGARIGQDGFGFAITETGFLTVPQLGRVILEDDVEVGANSTIDRGASHDTIIGAGTRIDNLVQIGHNARLGLGCVLVSQSGISGSTVLGDYVQIGAQAGLTGHLRIGAKARIGAQAGVMSDVEAGQAVVGSPALPLKEFFRNVAVLRKLSRRGGGADDKSGG